MTLPSDLRVLYHLAFKSVRGSDHADRMEAFYSGQAAAYDDFRRRLLPGRAELFRSIEVRPGSVWVDMGGATGSNLEYLGDVVDSLGHVYIVDLADSLLDIARLRVRREGWTNVTTVTGDATTFRPPGSVDVVTFSYSLTMIPDWFAAVENACAMLRAGGRIGVIDFYVSRKFPAEGLRRHSWPARCFWPPWFAADNVFLSPDHLPYLRRRFQPLSIRESAVRLPYLPLLRAPYYSFVGAKFG
ncbi:MAG: class I SAM-dependent methyltransferase [Thermoguttaceae bacterium]|nr:class I SAM-dependent methyltransferase [Thermoguttaceae bacterium]